MSGRLKAARIANAAISYKAEDWRDDFHVIHVLCEGRRIAYLRYSFDPVSRVVSISDLHVESNMARSHNWGSTLMQWLTGKTPSDSFRGQGIGSELVARLMTWARSHHAVAVVGKLAKGDVHAQPWLTEWYQRKGFRVTLPLSDKEFGEIRADL